MVICDECNKELTNDRALRSHKWKAHTIKGKELSNKQQALSKNKPRNLQHRKNATIGLRNFSDKKYGKFKQFNIKCVNCGDSFVKQIREKLYDADKHRFCSRSCSNTRIFNIEQRNKKAITPYGVYRSCIVCNEQFTRTSLTKGNSKKNICSKKCAGVLSAQRFVRLKGTTICDEAKKKISETRKKLFKSGQLNVTGGTTKWISYKNIRVQGTYEFRMCSCLDSLKDRGIIQDWKYNSMRIKYIGTDGKQHNYLIDFEVYKPNGKIEYIETKGFARDNDFLKWKSVKDSGLKLSVFYKRDIERLERMLKLNQ